MQDSDVPTALQFPSQHQQPAVSVHHKPASQTHSLGCYFLYESMICFLRRSARLFSVPLLWIGQTENRRCKSIFSLASGNESALFHSLALLPASHVASHFLTLQREFLLSASLEFCSRCALTRFSFFETHRQLSSHHSPPPPSGLRQERCSPATTGTHPCQLMTLTGMPGSHGSHHHGCHQR